LLVTNIYGWFVYVPEMPTFDVVFHWLYIEPVVSAESTDTHAVGLVALTKKVDDPRTSSFAPGELVPIPTLPSEVSVMPVEVIPVVPFKIILISTP
jgi:hypothetical protein